MQHGQENGTFSIEAKFAIFNQLMNNLRKLQFIPQPFKDQGLNIPGPGKLIGPSKGAQNVLFYLGSFTNVLYDLKVLV